MARNLDSGAKIGFATCLVTLVPIWPQQGGGDSNPRPLGTKSHVLDHSAPRSHSPRESPPWGIIPLGNHSPGESVPWGIIPLGNHPPGGSFPCGSIPLGNHSPGESFPWGVIPLGNHSPGGSFPVGSSQRINWPASTKSTKLH